MIDLHLLLRISRDDSDFRKKVMAKIHTNTQEFIRNFGMAVRHQKWTACFYQLQGFHNQITPYGQLSFLEEINETMSALLYEKDPIEKANACKRILNSASAGMQATQPVLGNNNEVQAQA